MMSNNVLMEVIQVITKTLPNMIKEREDFNFNKATPTPNHLEFPDNEQLINLILKRWFGGME
jgi:hypothetical protein